MRGQEIIDIAAIDRYAAVVPPVAADGISTAEISPVERVETVVLEIHPMVRCLSAQTIQFRQIGVALDEEVSVQRPQLSKSDFAADEQLPQLAVQHGEIPLQYCLEARDAPIVAHFLRFAFDLAMNQRSLEDVDAPAARDEAKQELVLDEAGKCFVKPVQMTPCLSPDGDNRRNAARVREQHGYREEFGSRHELADTVGRVIRDGGSDGGTASAKCQLAASEERFIEGVALRNDDEEGRAAIGHRGVEGNTRTGTSGQDSRAEPRLHAGDERCLLIPFRCNERN